jgi:hypothetical protein
MLNDDIGHGASFLEIGSTTEAGRIGRPPSEGDGK